jgi:hypothetical protein
MPSQILARKGPLQNCELHPLIYSLTVFALAQDVEKKKAEPVTPQSLKNLMVNRSYQPTAKK